MQRFCTAAIGVSAQRLVELARVTFDRPMRTILPSSRSRTSSPSESASGTARVDGVQVVERDRLAEVARALLAALPQPLRRCSRLPSGRAGRVSPPLVATTTSRAVERAQRFRDEPLVVAEVVVVEAIADRRVDEVAAAVDERADHGERRALVGPALDRQRHAAQADWRRRSMPVLPRVASCSQCSMRRRRARLTIRAMQTAIRCSLMRGGSSKGLYFRKRGSAGRRGAARPRARRGDGQRRAPDRRRRRRASADEQSRDREPLGVRPTPTSTICSCRSSSARAASTRRRTAATCWPASGRSRSRTASCEARDGVTPVRVRMLNSDNLCELLVETPGRRVQLRRRRAASTACRARAAPIVCNYLDVAGSATGSLLPTGRALDVVDGVEVTCIDNGMPVVVLRAQRSRHHGLRDAEGARREQGAEGEDRVDPLGRRPEA